MHFAPSLDSKHAIRGLGICMCKLLIGIFATDVDRNLEIQRCACLSYLNTFNDLED